MMMQRVITKAHIYQAIEEYERERSLRNIGLVEYFFDYIHINTKFYYALKNFLTTELRQIRLTDELTDYQRRKLSNVVAENRLSPASIGSRSLVNLFDTIESLLV